MKLKIEKLDRKIQGTELWLFIDDKVDNYKLRWAVGYRKKDKWWGVIALFPATHERALKKITKEMELAKQAIAILKKDKSVAHT